MLRKGDVIRDKDGTPIATVLVDPVRGAPIETTDFSFPNGKTPEPLEEMPPAFIAALKHAFDPD